MWWIRMLLVYILLAVCINGVVSCKQQDRIIKELKYQSLRAIK